MERLALAAVVGSALALAAPVSGSVRPPELARVAEAFAKRPVDVRCPSVQEWAADPHAFGVWSYANLRADFAALGPTVCEGALRIRDPRVPGWQRAAGALALVHESFHLRRWRHRRDEARVSCAAIRNFIVAVLLLGGSYADANDLLPYALALHVRTVERFPLYRSRSCRLPVWEPPA